MSPIPSAPLIQVVELLPLLSIFSALSAALYQLRNTRLRVFGVDYETAGQVRATVTGITLWCAGMLVIQVTRSDVPLFFVTCLPALLLGYSVATLYDRLHARPTFHKDRFWEITIAPCLSALAPISQPALKAIALAPLS